MQPTVRTLEQIISEIDPVYSGQINSVRQRQSAIPGQIKAEEQGLQARQNEAFGDIVSGARRRGLGFSGIPLGEQAKYTATEYLPALARLRQSGREQAMSLEDAIFGIQERRQNQALGLQQYDQQRFDTWQARQEELAAQRRAQAAADAQNSYLQSLFNQQQAQPTNRMSLDDIFGSPTSLRVSSKTQGSLLQPAGRVNVQPTASARNFQPAGAANLPRQPRLQGAGALSGVLRVR